MSLINQMLQDLEKRHASGAERGVLPDHVRVLPREQVHGMAWWLIGVAAAVAVIAVLAWQFNNHPPSTPPAPVAKTQPRSDPLSPGSPALPAPFADATERPGASSQPGAVATDRPIERKATAPKVAAVATEKSAPPPLATAAVVASEPETTAKSASAVEKAAPVTRAKPSAEKPKVMASRSTPFTPPVAPARPETAAPRTVEVLPETKVQAALAPPQIEKRLQTLTSQQLAENEYRDAANLLNLGRLADAQEGFRRALQHNPAHVGARQGLFGLLLDGKKNGEAEQVLQEGLKVNPNQPGFAMALASLQYERGDTAGAIETLQRTAPEAQSSPDYLARLAALLQRQSRHAEAIEYFQAALRLAPGSGVWLMGLGISLQALNRSQEAQDAFRRAKATNTLNADLQAFVDQRLKQLP